MGLTSHVIRIHQAQLMMYFETPLSQLMDNHVLDKICLTELTEWQQGLRDRNGVQNIAFDSFV
jgi:hypothetical protein